MSRSMIPQRISWSTSTLLLLLASTFTFTFTTTLLSISISIPTADAFFLNVPSTTKSKHVLSMSMSMSTTTKATTKAVTDVPSNIKLLILPGFGNDSTDYTIDRSLVSSLQAKGWKASQISVLPVERKDWFQVFLRGALDWNFWIGNAPPTNPAFSWYLERIVSEIQTLKEDEQIVLIGHSAGGWLGRAAIGYGSTSRLESETKIPLSSSSSSSSSSTSTTTTTSTSVDLSKVAGMVTLGAPHLPPPPEVMDMTRGALRLTNEQFPGSFHDDPSSNNTNDNNNGFFYITAIGLSVKGKKQERLAGQGKGRLLQRLESIFEPTTIQGFAFNSYEAVCGDGTTIGDGVVPQCAGHLDGALQLDLDGVFHSINTPENWYGSIDIIDNWHQPMLDRLNTQNTKGTPFSFSLPFFN